MVNNTLHAKKHKLYWNSQFERWAKVLLPGDYAVVNHEHILVTVLGSCVSVCLSDTHAGIAGMNHFMLPRLSPALADGKEPISSLMAENYHSRAGRYGVEAMELLINEMIKAGGKKSRFKAKVFGGGSVTNSSIDIGAKNIEFALSFLKTESIPIISSFIGGQQPIKIFSIIDDDAVYVKKLGNSFIDKLLKTEENYLSELAKSKIVGDITLFDDKINAKRLP